jgi:nucleotide-binding universal stress UspA family protein
MFQDPKTITAFLDASPAGRRRAQIAAQLARRWDAHLVGVHIVFNDARTHPSAAYARSSKAMAGVIALEKRIDDACQGAAKDVGEYFHQVCAEQGVPGEFRPIERDRTNERAIINSLHSDLLVVGNGECSGLPEDISVDRMLPACRTPLLIIPNKWNGSTIGEKVMIAWNASPEARRAVSDSLCFLLEARSVTAVIVDPSGCRMLGKETGCDIAQHLNRHGIALKIEEVASHGKPVSEVILNRATEEGCDLVVAGARNPAHLVEVLFGNATRALLKKMPVPALISQ